MASFLCHVTSMQSPQNPSYADTGILPVNDVRDLRTEARFENVAAHQRYLEKLQLETNALRSWSNGIQDQIMGEAQQVHLQFMRMIRDLKRQDDPHPWPEGWRAASSQPPPPPAQSSAASSSIPMKAAPAPRAQQAPSSSMSSTPRNAPFPSQMG